VAAWSIGLGMAFGVVFLVTVKPGLLRAAVALVLAAVVGLLASIPAVSRTPAGLRGGVTS
jgi:hypothetical protein